MRCLCGCEPADRPLLRAAASAEHEPLPEVVDGIQNRRFWCEVAGLFVRVGCLENLHCCTILHY